MRPWKWDHEMGIPRLMPIVDSLAAVFAQEPHPEDGSTSRCCSLLRHTNPSNEPTPGPMNYREAVWKFFRSSETSVSLVAPYEGQKMKASTKSDAQDPVGKPTTVATRKCEPKPPKVIREPGLGEDPVSYFAEPIFTSSGKIAAAVAPVVGKAPPPNNLVNMAYEMLGKDAQPKNVPVCSEIWYECNGLSVTVVSQHLKRRRAERKACMAAASIADKMDMALLEQSIEASADPLWVLVILMISQAFSRTASGIFNVCMQRKWLARAVVIWMLVGTIMASPIVAASVSSPAPRADAKFHSLETTAVFMPRRLTEVSSWAEMKVACGSNYTSGTVALSDDFVMGTYEPTPAPQYSGIDFSGKHLVIIGNNNVLDAGEYG
jgi:hypothetical protein